MKILTYSRLAAVAAALCLCAGHSAAQAPAGAGTLRIVSYNIHNGVPLTGDKRDCAAQEGVLRSLAPDVAAVLEVDSLTTRHPDFILERYATALDMHSAYSPAIAYQGGAYGIGTLSRHKPLRVTRIALPGREEARTLLVSEFPRYVFAAAHFSLTQADRLKSLEIVRSEAAKYSKPFFLAGDLNFAPGSPEGKELASRFTLLTDPKAPTFPSGKPAETIDYIALYNNAAAKAVTLLRRGVDKGRQASDHCAVWAEVRFGLNAAELLPREPYLQDFAPNAVTVMWQTGAAAHAWVEYGADTTALRTARDVVAGQEPCLGVENKVRLDSLEPGKRYYYRVCASEVMLNEAYYKVLGPACKGRWHSFTLPAPDATGFTAIVLNDLHCNDAVMRRLFQVASDKGIRPDLVFFNGDCAPEADTQARAINMVNNLMAAAGAADTHTVIIRGNHEIRNAYSAGMTSLTDNFGGKTYGAFSWGDTRFVVLDCGEDKPDNFWVYYGLNDFTRLRLDQKAFLEREAKSREFRKASRRILLNHIPIWGKADEVYTDRYHPWTGLWSPALSKMRFDIDITAHAHVYYFNEKGAYDSPCPSVGGGGPELKGQCMGTLTVLRKSGRELRLTVFGVDGSTLLDRQL